MVGRYKEIFIVLLIRVIVAAVAAGIGWYLCRTEGGFEQVPRLLFGMAFFIIGGIVIAVPIARLLAEPSGSLFYPIEHFDRPQPMYSIPESKVKKGLYEEAIAGYMGIAEKYPEEIKPYIEMMTIAARDLRDAKRADRFYAEGMAHIRDDKDKLVLTMSYQDMMSLLGGKPEWYKKQQARTLTVGKRD